MPSCSFSVVAQHSSVGNGANKKGGSMGINTVVEVLSKNLKTLLLFNFYVVFFFFCAEPGRDEDAWSRIQELPYCVSNILLKNPVVCQYVSFQFSSGKFH